MLAFVVVCCALLPSAASASSRTPAADPAPQAAATPSPTSSASPDPAPQAAVNSHPATNLESAATTAPQQTTPPEQPKTVQPVRTQPSPVAAVRSSTHDAVRRATPVRRHRVARSRVPAHPAPRVHRPRSEPVSLSFPFASLPKALLGLPRAAFHAGAPAHGDGVLLLLSSVAMAALAAASFALLRRLRRLEESAR